MFAGYAIAQQTPYPSPTFNNLTVLGNLSSGSFSPSSISINGPVSGNTLLTIISQGYPANQPGSFKFNQITATDNQPLSGSLSPGAGNSQTVNTFRVSTNVAGAGGFDPSGNPILGYTGAELKGIQSSVVIQSPLGATSNHKGDIVAGSFAINASNWMGDQTLYSQSNGTGCVGPSTPYPSPNFPVGGQCWTRQIVGYENDNNNDASIPPYNWPGNSTDPSTIKITSVVYNPSNAGYSNQPTLTFNFNIALPPFLLNGGTPYYTIQLSTTSGDPTTYNDHDPYGVCAQSVPPSNCLPPIYPGGPPTVVANPNYVAPTTTNVTIDIATPAVIHWTAHGLTIGTGITFTNSGGTLPTGITSGTAYYIISAGFTANSFEISATPGGSAVNTSGSQSGTQMGTAPSPQFATSTKLEDRWQTLDILNNGTTLVTTGPPAPVSPSGTPGFGVISNVWLGYVSNRYGMNLIAQGDANAGKEAAVNIQGGWRYGLLFDNTKVSGVPSPAVQSNGAIIAGDSKGTIGNILYFPCANIQNIANIAGFTLTGVDWCANSPSRAGTNMTLGTMVLYGASANTSNTNPSPLGGTAPISIGNSFEAAGVGLCPSNLLGKGQCQIVYQGKTQYDIAWNGAPDSSVHSTCSSGTTLWGTGSGGSPILLTTDGSGVANSTNILNLTPNGTSQAGTVDVIIQEQGANRIESWVGIQLMFQRNSTGQKSLTNTYPAPLDPGTIGGAIALAPDGSNEGLDITVTPPSSGTWTATGCAHMAIAR